MMTPSANRGPFSSLLHRLLERLTAAKTYIWILRRRAANGELDPQEVDAHLQVIEAQIDDAVKLAENLQGQSPPSQ